MEICNEDHEEICYTSQLCPLCALMEETDAQIKDLEGQIEDLNVEIENAKDA